MVQDIYIIDNNNELIENLKQSFKRELDEYKFTSVKTSDIEVALRNIPALIIIDEDTANANIVEFCKSIRSNEDNSITPIIVVSSNRDREHIVEVLKTDVEYFIKKPIDEEYFYYTIKNIVDLLSKNRRISPLTGLPGNVQIQAEMKKRLLNKEKFAILYFDLDNFKAYNDVYGDYEEVCKNIIAEFDKYTVDFYNEVDAERGFVEVANRRGIIEQFPLTSLSIAVLEVDSKIYKTTLEIGEIASQIKHKAKAILGSTYVINKRRF